jgi:hypothetical protein
MRALRARIGAKAQLRSPSSHARRALFAASLDEEPEGFQSDAIGVERGRQIEAFKNKRNLVGLSKK